ncbi:MAG: hypothetical protein C5B49_03315 [Bdellovibrio sp.]|nr:MAG: hypothetical protein C5B49_03315 [Bdellovibrio sp.]
MKLIIKPGIGAFTVILSLSMTGTIGHSEISCRNINDRGSERFVSKAITVLPTTDLRRMTSWQFFKRWYRAPVPPGILAIQDLTSRYYVDEADPVLVVHHEGKPWFAVISGDYFEDNRNNIIPKLRAVLKERCDFDVADSELEPLRELTAQDQFNPEFPVEPLPDKPVYRHQERSFFDKVMEQKVAVFSAPETSRKYIFLRLPAGASRFSESWIFKKRIDLRLNMNRQILRLSMLIPRPLQFRKPTKINYDFNQTENYRLNPDEKRKLEEFLSENIDRGVSLFGTDPRIRGLLFFNGEAAPLLVEFSRHESKRFRIVRVIGLTEPDATTLEDYWTKRSLQLGIKGSFSFRLNKAIYLRGISMADNRSDTVMLSPEVLAQVWDIARLSPLDLGIFLSELEVLRPLWESSFLGGPFQPLRGNQIYLHFQAIDGQLHLEGAERKAPLRIVK